LWCKRQRKEQYAKPDADHCASMRVHERTESFKWWQASRGHDQ
jgi:hypothetical protein